MVSRGGIQTQEIGRYLGLMASLSLRRFLILYRKYSDDQPRDERGRWVETGADDNSSVDTVGMVKSLEKSGDPEIDTLTVILADTLEQAIDDTGPGSGAAYGTLVHSRFEAAVNAINMPGVGVERSWLGGEQVPYGTAGSIRTDVSLRDEATGEVKAVWDVKTGGARMTDARADQIRSELRVGRDVPVIELHYERGATIKAVFLHRGVV